MDVEAVLERYNWPMGEKEQKLLPAYLAVGEDELKRQTVATRLRKRVESMGDLSFNHDVLDAVAASGSDIAIACNTMPFASPLRLVEVVNIDKLAKGEADVLVAYLASPSDSTVLLMSGEKLAKNTRLYKAVAALGKGAVIDCASMKRYELAKALRSMATGHGFTITDRAATRLIELVGEDTVRLDTELKKLALAHRSNDPVNEREVEELVAQTSEAKPWEFVDAFSRRETKTCLKLLTRLSSSSPYALMALCTNRLRELCCARSLAQRGQSAELASTLKLPDWRVKNHLSWARNFSEDELKAAFSSARDCERAMKTGADPQVTFMMWVINVTARHSR